uniref:Uncharacterized protein n=1 Tax=Oryza punctata TaxID=4537 RepID=A0A0E0MPK9_ORYPU
MDLLFLLYRPRPSRRRVALPAAACRRGAHTLLRRFLPPPARRNCSQLSPLLPPPPNRGYFSSGIRIFLGRRLARDGDAIGVSGGGWSRPTVGWIDGREEGVIGGSDHASKFLSGTGCSGVQIRFFPASYIWSLGRWKPVMLFFKADLVKEKTTKASAN